MAAIPSSWKRKVVKFPDPVEQAQVVFATRPEDMRRTYDAKQSFLQSCSDYKNMMSGVDFSNQKLFQTVTDKLTETDIKNMLPWTGNEVEDKKRMDKLQLLFKDAGSPALKYFLGTPEVKALVDQAKTGLDNRILDTYSALDAGLTSLQNQFDQAVGKPVQIPMDFISRKFARADLKELPLFEIVMDPAGADKGIMGVFIDLESRSYFELLPRNENYKSSVRAINEKAEGKDYPLTEEFCEVLTENKTTNNTLIKGNYLEIVNHTIGEKLGNIIIQLQTGQEVGYPKSNDEDMIMELKLQAARLIDEWATKSVKFREWIVPLYPGDIIKEAEKLLALAKEEDSQPPPVKQIPETPRVLRSDSRRKKELEESVFRTPARMPAPTVKSEFSLSPEGKTLLAEYMKKGTNKKQAREEIKKMAKNDPENFGDLVIKKGGKIKTILVPPSKIARFERIKVILGALEADSTADYLEEYTAIVDSLLSDKTINKDQHKFLIQKYLDCK
jgi:hypothetical protein